MEDPKDPFSELLDDLSAPTAPAAPETALETISETTPEGTQSLLSPQALEELSNRAVREQKSVPATFLEVAAPHMHSTSGIVDFATVVCMAVAQGELKVSQSAELRKWAELMYSCAIAGQQGDVQVNYVQQLIQLAGGPQGLEPEVVDVQESIRYGKIGRRKKAQGE
tara:strand:- start:156 stop:656 length:501 start_codon:yes stop_codon:yes gene_type:complete